MKTAYKQLIDDYVEIFDSSKFGFLFGRIMNYIFRRLSDEEKYLYIVIREHISLEHLNRILGDDWVRSTFTRTDRLIALARDKWQWEKERVVFT